MDAHDIIPVPPLDVLMRDPTITEIMVNGPDRIFIERGGVRQDSGLRFEGEHRLRYAIERMLETNPGFRVDLASPMVDLALPDGSRVNICIPPVVVGGPHLTIRRFNRPVRVPADLVALGTLSEPMAVFLGEAVRTGASILYAGATGTGKTTLLEVLATRIDPTERVVVIEDTMELHLEQPNVVRMLGRPANIEGKGEITLGTLFRNSLRMRPKRIILGEVRGGEVIDYLQAINSGHGGAQAVIHAANPREAVLRMIQLAMMSGRGADRRSVSQQIIEGLDLIVQLEQHADGVRRVVAITQVGPNPGAPDGIALEDIFRWTPRALVEGRVEGRFGATGRIPRILPAMRLAGSSVGEATFTSDLDEEELDEAVLGEEVL